MIYYTNTKFKSLYNTENLNKKQKICEKVKQNKKNIIRNTRPPFNLETKLLYIVNYSTQKLISLVWFDILEIIVLLLDQYHNRLKIFQFFVSV